MKVWRAGLIAFGVVEILGGVVLTLVAVMMVVAFMFDDGEPIRPPRLSVVIALEYVSFAAVLMTLGLGSIRTRRSARASNLAFGWTWLLTGLCGVVAWGFVQRLRLDEMLSTAGEFGPGATAYVIVTMSSVFILMPLTLVIFYRSSRVKATVEARDPAPHWTDNLPEPVLVFGASMIAWAAGTFFLGWSFKAVPIAGVTLREPAIQATAAGLALVMLLIAAGILKRRGVAWWAAAGLLSLAAACCAWRYSRLEAALVDAATAAHPRTRDLALSSLVDHAWVGAVSLTYLVLLLHVRRYFFSASPSDASSSASDVASPPPPAVAS